MAEGAGELSGSGELRDAFWAYERALMANDLPELDRLFAPGSDTLRGDAAGILIGHDAISEFRVGRGGAPKREILRVEVREISDDAALVIAVTAPATGGRGQQTQLWRLIDGAWSVQAAHVSLPAPALNPTVWRVAAAPLVAGGTTGVLFGETVAVKDLYEIEGFAVGGGVPQYLAEASPATATSSAVAALLDAGASITGIAQTDEFAYSIAGRNPHYGTPPNAAVAGAVPGGSSSGPASAVALGQASIGLGTDTAGSIRVPASYQGLWGLRSTYGAVSLDGVLPLAPSFDTVGWMTRSPVTLRAVAQASLDTALQVAVAPGYVVFPGFSAHIEPDVRDAFHLLLERVPGGVDIVDLGDLDELFFTFRTVQQAEAWRVHGEWIKAHPGALGDDIAGRFEAASRVTPEQESAAREVMRTARDRLERVLGDRVLILPAASSAAPSVLADSDLIERTRQGTLRLTCIAGLTGRPGLSIPLMTVPRAGSLAGAPVGLGLVGPRNSDVALIEVGEALAAALRP